MGKKLIGKNPKFPGPMYIFTIQYRSASFDDLVILLDQWLNDDNPNKGVILILEWSSYIYKCQA